MAQHQQHNQSQSGKQFSKQDDIVEMILEDHKPLKQLIQIMKDTDKDLDAREDAFAEFAPLLICHAKPEEMSLYIYMKGNEELREEGFEGDVEHQLADQLCEEIMRTEDPDEISAKIKVLAELVEHHIEEEEEELLPDFRKNSDPQERMQLGEKFLMLKTQYLEKGGQETPHESDPNAEIH
ncbi:hemerythrin domain-containing protein [Bdellovibrio sp. HCB185ZH]|uniref:hemerythrin domain-containing protein n=1 Tax=Bdellovibrio sp. HCB185ZH TaxID=3394235 RepID=UPI0039A4C3D6